MNQEKLALDYKKPENSLERQSPFVAIKFDPSGSQQKFVEFQSKNGVTYIYSVPLNERKFHEYMIVDAVKFFELSGQVVRKGGGYLQRDSSTNIISVFGNSTKLGSFDEKNTSLALKEAFPTLDIIVESE